MLNKYDFLKSRILIHGQILVTVFILLTLGSGPSETFILLSIQIMFVSF